MRYRTKDGHRSFTGDIEDLLPIVAANLDMSEEEARNLLESYNTGIIDTQGLLNDITNGLSWIESEQDFIDTAKTNMPNPINLTYTRNALLRIYEDLQHLLNQQDRELRAWYFVINHVINSD